MVDGLKHFLQHFDGFQDHFVLIGGTACDLWMGENGLEYRATKDLDIVIVAESLPQEFFERFWEFIGEGKYASLEQSESRPAFYRFKNPTHEDHPKMIELFTRNYLEVPDEYHLTPVPAEQGVSSLSAILLGDDYYNFILSSRTTIEDAPTVPIQCLIPLKARAYLDLLARKENGESIDSRQIKKHRNDVFNRYRTLAPVDRYQLPRTLGNDLNTFLNLFPASSQDWTAIKASVPGLPPPEQVVDQIRENFGLASN